MKAQCWKSSALLGINLQSLMKEMKLNKVFSSSLTNFTSFILVPRDIKVLLGMAAIMLEVKTFAFSVSLFNEISREISYSPLAVVKSSQVADKSSSFHVH